MRAKKVLPDIIFNRHIRCRMKNEYRAPFG